MSDIDTTVYRARLEEEHRRLTNAVGFLERENPGSVADELGELTPAHENHPGDTATATYDRGLDESLEEGARTALQDVEAALRRIEDGTYGVCEVCGGPVGAQRLAAIPWARLCIDDQRKVNG